MQKVVINNCYGGFNLSKKAKTFLGMSEDDYDEMCYYRGHRADSKLVECVETLGEEASGFFSELAICEIPDDVGDNWYISKYDGMETVEENHRSWRC